MGAGHQQEDQRGELEWVSKQHSFLGTAPLLVRRLQKENRLLGTPLFR